MSKIFDTNNIILLKVDEADLTSFLLKMDVDDDGQPLFPLEQLTEEIIEVIPEYVFAEYENPNIPQTQAIRKLREAANSIYKIRQFDLMRRVSMDNDSEAEVELRKLPYRNRGEFGELLLHFLLRDFKNTIPLVSKAYFKDSSGVPAHGFDAVHISTEDEILWLGESKLYTNAKQGMDALIEDLNNHLQTDYLNDQFVVIKKNLSNNSIPQRAHWLETLSSAGTLKDKLKMVNIPMLCIYENDIYSKFADTEMLEAENYHEMNVRELKAYFDSKNTNPLKNRCNIILMLLPIKNKYDLVKRLHERLWHMQSM